jgi:hypothetical protein
VSLAADIAYRAGNLDGIRRPSGLTDCDITCEVNGHNATCQPA